MIKATRKRRPGKLPRQQYPRALEREYAKFARSVVDMVRAAYADVFAALPAEFDRRFDQRFDAPDDLFAKMEEAQKRLRQSLDTGRLQAFLKRHAERLEDWNAKEFAKQARAAVGVDLFASDPKLLPRARAYVTGNVSLIKDLGERAASRINNTVLQAVQSGTTYRDLADSLARNLDGDMARATLIARDQTGKLYGQINSDRQKSLGIKRFIWRTSNDNRVREEHEELEGQTFSYDDPPSEGLPGEPIQCRCYAEPIFDILDE